MRGLLPLNDQYRRRFHSYTATRDYQVDLPSKQRFDSFVPEAYLHQVVKEEAAAYTQLLRCATDNAEALAAYMAACRQVYDAAPIPTDLPRCFKSVQDWRTYERGEFEAAQLKPQVDLAVRVSWGYTSPQGRSSYRDERTFHLGQVADMMAHARERAARESGAAYQRGLMTPGLRNDILRRDGYRCRICGRGAADGVKLEVDHIVPVSKGGKTEPSNLQTLCWDCNRGKSDKPM